VYIEANPPIHDPNEANIKIAEIRRAADSLPWLVYAGPRTRRTLEGAFVVAERIRGLAFGLALREWAELTGQEWGIIRRERDRLLDLGWLHRNPCDRPGRTARLSIRRPRHIQYTPHIPSLGGISECAAGAAAVLRHDAWRPEALGEKGWYVFQICARSALQTLESLATRTGSDPEDLAHLLYELEDIGLLHLDDVGVRVDVERRAVRQLLDAVAARFGTDGALAQDLVRHEQEREAFRERGYVNVREVPTGAA
jgi:hypothetical protein